MLFQIEAIIATDGEEVRGTVIVGADSAHEAEEAARRRIPGTRSVTVLRELKDSLQLIRDAPRRRAAAAVD
jgi:hypothetical protein